MTAARRARCGFGAKGSDLCQCGDYRSQHEQWRTTGGMRCRVGSCRVPYGDPWASSCPKFELSRPATAAEQQHWNEYHGARLPAAGPEAA